MGANTAGIYGAQIFREDDKPRYRRGFTINIAILALGLVLAGVRTVDDYRRKRRLANAIHAQHDEDSDEEAVVPSDVQPAPVEYKDLKINRVVVSR